MLLSSDTPGSLVFNRFSLKFSLLLNVSHTVPEAFPGSPSCGTCHPMPEPIPQQSCSSCTTPSLCQHHAAHVPSLQETCQRTCSLMSRLGLDFQKVIVEDKNAGEEHAYLCPISEDALREAKRETHLSLTLEMEGPIFSCGSSNRCCPARFCSHIIHCVLLKLSAESLATTLFPMHIAPVHEPQHHYGAAAQEK